MCHHFFSELNILFSFLFAPLRSALENLPQIEEVTEEFSLVAIFIHCIQLVFITLVTFLQCIKWQEIQWHAKEIYYLGKTYQNTIKHMLQILLYLQNIIKTSFLWASHSPMKIQRCHKEQDLENKGRELVCSWIWIIKQGSMSKSTVIMDRTIPIFPHLKVFFVDAIAKLRNTPDNLTCGWLWCATPLQLYKMIKTFLIYAWICLVLVKISTVIPLF